MIEEGYQLKSALARVCLLRPPGESSRALAWANSICLLFLAVAWSGARPGLPVAPPVPPLDEPVTIILQPMSPPPPQLQPSTSEESADDRPAPAPRIVAVTPDSPSINFSVPTIGNVLVANAVASPPHAVPLKNAPAMRNLPRPIGSTGTGGDRPQPPYPEMALKFGQQGTVTLLLTVDDSGLVRSILVKETSGSPILDRNAQEYVRKHWIVPPGKEGRIFEAAISYVIRSN